MTDVQARLPTIDMLKGCAILWVLLIHSGALYGRPVAVYLFNHAVPIFIVLFGINSELWWRRRPAASVATWYRDRARRLLVPMYAALPVWWALALALRRPLLVPLGARLGGRAALLSLAALAPCIAVQEVPSGGTAPFFADRLMELPLTVALLVAMRPLARVPPLAHGLAWLGQNSYGLYIGQM